MLHGLGQAGNPTKFLITTFLSQWIQRDFYDCYRRSFRFQDLLERHIPLNAM